MISQLEYLWIDGTKPTATLRSKTRLMHFKNGSPKLADLPEWSFDGSSTFQASGNNSDCLLQPVNMVRNPLLDGDNYLVMCEVLTEDHQPHPSNTRCLLRQVLEAGASKEDPWFGFEQEYTLFKAGRPLGWPETGYPGPQGPYYCGVGSTRVYGRDLVEAHAEACIEAGIMLYGTNAEVMPAQWEFQIGYRGIESESADPLNVADHMWFARWLLYRLGEEADIEVSLDNKPVSGDWNGAGQHTNFSTKAMRDSQTGMASIEKAIKALANKHDEHIALYGFGNDLRLTGMHETCSIKEFRHGIADRGSSIRIPRGVANNGCGYLEDRRPGANADPYLVAMLLLKTVCLSASAANSCTVPEQAMV